MDVFVKLRNSQLVVKAEKKPEKAKDATLVVSAKGGTPIKVKDKEHLKELRAQYGIEHIMNMATEHGIEHQGTTEHKNFNYMKAAQAIGDHVASGKDFHVKKPFTPEKGEYHVKLKGSEGKSVYKKVPGETVDLGMDDIEGFVHKNGDGTHTVSCRRTGLALSGKQGTKIEAIEHAKTRLSYYKDKVATALASQQSVPEVKQTKKITKGLTSDKMDWSFLRGL
ncbi:hypothetical protein D3C74_50360 [compost metagenome]